MYSFKVQARNSFGLSDFSAPITLLCAYIPSIPSPPSTQVVGNSILIKWTAPSANGSPITSYRIKVIQKDNNFSEDLVHCNGNTASIINALNCTIPISTLLAQPYNLALGDSVYAIITSSNAYGESANSPAGNGATIVLVPDAPINVQDNVAVTNSTVIGLIWSGGVSHGG